MEYNFIYVDVPPALSILRVSPVAFATGWAENRYARGLTGRISFVTRYIVRRLIAMPFLIWASSPSPSCRQGHQGRPADGHRLRAADEQSRRRSRRPSSDGGSTGACPSNIWSISAICSAATWERRSSPSGRSPQDILFERLPATLELVIAAMLIGTVIGITLGVLAAYYRTRRSTMVRGCLP